MFCPNCGTEIKEGSKFCSDCGFSLCGDSSQNNDLFEEVQIKENSGFLTKTTKIIIAIILLIVVIDAMVICFVSPSSAQSVSFAGKDFYIPNDAKIINNGSSTNNNYSVLMLEYIHNENNVTIYAFNDKEQFNIFLSLYDEYTIMDSKLPVTIYKDFSEGSYGMMYELDGHYFNVVMYNSLDNKVLDEFSKLCEINPKIKDYS